MVAVITGVAITSINRLTVVVVVVVRNVLMIGGIIRRRLWRRF